MADTRSGRQHTAGAHGRSRPHVVLSGVLVGLGLVSSVDETVFHQLLHWHHFYDRGTPAAGLVSDGLFHAFGFAAIVAGLFLFADLRRRRAVAWRRWIGALLLGAGAFQLYDGLVQHKLLRLHQIRYQVEIMPYDVVWNVTAAVMIILGVALLRTGGRTPDAD